MYVNGAPAFNRGTFEWIFWQKKVAKLSGYHLGGSENVFNQRISHKKAFSDRDWKKWPWLGDRAPHYISIGSNCKCKYHDKSIF